VLQVNSDILLARQNKNLLFDFYGTLLTEKQRNIFAMSTIDDCSFTEIGKELGITPQAVADVVKRATIQLEKYESSLGMVEKFHSQKQMVEEMEISLNRLNQLGSMDITDAVNEIKDSLNRLL